MSAIHCSRGRVWWVFLPLLVEAFAAAAEGERAGVAGVVQGAQDPPVLQRHPGQLALVGPGTDPHREEQPFGVELLHGRRAEPVRAKRVNTCRIACCTPVSGSSTTLPVGS